MPAMTKQEASEKLAKAVEKAKPSTLIEIQAELFPEAKVSSTPKASDIVRLIREGLAAEEIVDLWNVIFPADRNVWFDEGDESIHFNEEVVGYAD